MRRASVRSLGLLACAALVLGATAAVVVAGEPTAVKKGREIVSKNAENICLFAHAKATYSYKGNDFVGSKKVGDDYELTYKFTVKGRLKTQTMNIAFFFKDNGTFDFLKVGDYTTIYEPFKKVSDAYLKDLRQQMSKRPAFADNADAIRRIDNANAQQLCEMYLKSLSKPPRPE